MAGGQQAGGKAGRWADRQARERAGRCAVGQVGIQVGRLQKLVFKKVKITLERLQERV